MTVGVKVRGVYHMPIQRCIRMGLYHRGQEGAVVERHAVQPLQRATELAGAQLAGRMWEQLHTLCLLRHTNTPSTLLCC